MVRVAIAYVIVGWVLMQATDILFPLFGIPEWGQRFIVILLGIGFPIVLFVSWAYEVTPEGVMKTAAVDKSKSITHGTGQRINKLTIGALGLAVAFLLVDKFFINPGQTPEIIPEAQAEGASIAVLPFIDLSPEGDQEYFSDGISEELLNVLAKIPDLRVAARTSSFQFKGQNQDISNIGAQLNVTYVLEGSVRRADTQLRITAQLIDVETGFHLWSETYDRKLEDVFAIQDEISAAIVDALGEHLGITAETVPAKTRAVDTSVYSLYLEAKALARTRNTENDLKALEMLKAVLEVEPGYAPAHATLAAVYFSLGESDTDLTNAQLTTRAERHLETALALAPEFAEAFAVKGRIAEYRGEVEDALRLYDQSLALNPNQSSVHQSRSVILFDTFNRFEEGLEANRLAVAIDPLDHNARLDLATSLAWAGHFDEAQMQNDLLKGPDPSSYYNVQNILFISQGLYIENLKNLIVNAEIQKQRSGDFPLAGALANFGLEQEALRFADSDSLLWTVFATLNQPEKALPILRKRAQENPEAMELQTSLAFNLMSVGQYREAAEILNYWWEQMDGRISMGGNFDRSTAATLYFSRRALGDAEGAKEVYDALVTFDEFLHEANVSIFKFPISAPRAMLVNEDRDKGFAALDAMADEGLFFVNLRMAPLLEVWTDPRMAALQAKMDENLETAQGEFISWWCAAGLPETSPKPLPETCN